MKRTLLTSLLAPLALPLALPLLFAASGCVSAPDVIVVDRKTALEEQASGRLAPLSDELESAGLLPRAAPLTGAQLAAAGVTAGAGEASLATDETSDLERLDDLLVRRCVGEARDGTLVDTHGQCAEPGDVPRLGRLVERANRGRWQMWRWLQAQRPSANIDDVRRAWRAAHLSSVVCGAQVQREDGGWEPKKC